MSRYGKSSGAAESTEMIVREYGITREQSDRWAVRSHQNATAAWTEGKFDAEVVPVPVPQKKGEPRLFVRDEGIREDASLDAMAESLAKGERIEIRGFGSFGLNYRPPRVGRNPKSGEKVQVPEKYVPHFKAGKELRERVDSAAEDAAAAPRERASQPAR